MILRAAIDPFFDVEQLFDTQVEELALKVVRFFSTGLPTSLPNRGAAQIDQLAKEHAQRINSLMDRFPARTPPGAASLEHIPSGWNQPDGMCPMEPRSPVRAFP
jgi:hypothetical protein